MSDDANAGSNPVASETAPVEQAPVVTEPAQTEPVNDVPSKTARESLEKAFAKVTEPDAKPADKPRDAAGKFAPKEKIEVDPNKTVTENLTDATKQALAPPSRFAKQAQTDWALAPESVKTEVARLEKELTQGLEKYKSAAEAFEPMRQYHDLAQQHGVKLEHAMQNYLALDHMWATDPIQGFLQTCTKARIDPQALINAVVNGGQLQRGQPDPRDGIIQNLSREIASLKEDFGGVKQTVQQTQQQHAYNQTLNEIQAFAKDHPYFEDLLPAMTEMVETKFAKDLSDAYDKAVRLSPEVSAKLEADKAARQPKQPGSNPKAALSITGTPAGGSNPTTKPAGSAREALTRSFASLGLSP